jgi:hypothetical protein
MRAVLRKAHNDGALAATAGAVSAFDLVESGIARIVAEIVPARAPILSDFALTLRERLKKNLAASQSARLPSGAPSSRLTSLALTARRRLRENAAKRLGPSHVQAIDPSPLLLPTVHSSQGALAPMTGRNSRMLLQHAPTLI